MTSAAESVHGPAAMLPCSAAIGDAGLNEPVNGAAEAAAGKAWMAESEKVVLTRLAPVAPARAGLSATGAMPGRERVTFFWFLFFVLKEKGLCFKEEAREFFLERKHTTRPKKLKKPADLQAADARVLDIDGNRSAHHVPVVDPRHVDTACSKAGGGDGRLARKGHALFFVCLLF